MTRKDVDVFQVAVTNAQHTQHGSAAGSSNTPQYGKPAAASNNYYNAYDSLTGQAGQNQQQQQQDFKSFVSQAQSKAGSSVSCK